MIYFVNNLFKAELFENKKLQLILALTFALINNLLILGYQFEVVIIGMKIMIPNVFVGIPLLINLQVIKTQSLSRVLFLSSIVASFFYFSLFSLLTV